MHNLLNLGTLPTFCPSSLLQDQRDSLVFKLLPCVLFGFFLALQAPENWCVCFSLVVRSDESAFSWEIPEDRNTQLAGHSQIWHHILVLLGGLHCSSGHAEVNGPSEIPAPKVRARAVTLGEGGKKPCELFATGASLSSFDFLFLCFFFLLLFFFHLDKQWRSFLPF